MIWLYRRTCLALEIYEMASKFAKTRMRPLMADWDKREHFPVDVLREAGALGLASIYCKPEFGGTGLTRFDASLVFEALAEGCVSTAAYISIQHRHYFKLKKRTKRTIARMIKFKQKESNNLKEYTKEFNYLINFLHNLISQF